MEGTRKPASSLPNASSCFVQLQLPLWNTTPLFAGPRRGAASLSVSGSFPPLISSSMFVPSPGQIEVNLKKLPSFVESGSAKPVSALLISRP